MKGLIIINGYPNGVKFFHQAERIAEELIALGVATTIMKNGEVCALLNGDGRAENNLLEEYSFAIYLDKDKYLGRMLEACGLRLFNCAEAVELCDDKMRTYLALQDSDVPLVRTIPAPLCYTPNVLPDEAFLSYVAEKLSFPLVAKKSYGSFGAGVQLIRDFSELKKMEREWLYTPHFYQAYVQESSGRDIRVIVIGGKAIGAMERVAQEGEFRSNVELGGQGRKVCLDVVYAEVAEKTAKALGLDYCGVDLLEGKDGAIVCEVNSNAFFEGFESVTGINVAKAYASYVLKCFS